jgi:TPR repeat protein
MYMNARGVKRDFKKAEEWYRKADGQGNKNAKSALAAFEKTKKKIEEEIKSKGYRRYGKAAEAGDVTAMYNLAEAYESSGFDDKDGLYDMDKALEWYTWAAEKGNQEAQFQVGRYGYGNGIKATDVVKWLRIAAQGGHLGAQFELGKRLTTGIGEVPLNKDEAKIWIRKIIESGDASLQYEMGDFLLEQSDKTKVDYTDAVEALFNQVAISGNATLISKIGSLYIDRKDNVTAMKWKTMAVEQGGNYSDMRSIGFMYESGKNGIERNYTEAEKWYKKAENSAISSKDSWGIRVSRRSLSSLYESMKNYGEAKKVYESLLYKEKGNLWERHNYARILHEGGYGITKDNGKAMELLQYIVKNKDKEYTDEIMPKVYELMGDIYREGGHGITKDIPKAIEYYKTNIGGWSLFELATMYMEGIDVPQDMEEGIRLLQSAAEGWAPDDAINTLGLMYLCGEGVPKDAEKGLEWLEKGAAEKQGLSLYTLGSLYLDGQLVPKDEKKAFDYFKKAADEDYADAQYNLGIMYLHGSGVEQSDSQAIELFSKAAEQDQADALYAMGGIYEEGIGVAKNMEEAKKWYRRAAEQGYQEAINILNNLKE